MPRPRTDLTGLRRYRRSWLGKLILQVEVQYRRWDGLDTIRAAFEWRDATIDDVVMLERLDAAAAMEVHPANP